LYDNKTPDSERFNWIGEEFWDIFIAEEFSTTPWDVREHLTVWDFQRLNLLNSARSKRVEALNKSKNTASNYLNSSGKRK
jgi:hypothetical protein